MIVERPCPTCGRPPGDHLVREWSVCMGTPWEDLAYEETTAPVSFKLDGRELVVADHITVRSMVSLDPNGVVPLRVPTLLLTFSVSVPDSAPQQVAEVAFIGTPDGLRRMGVIVRDAANGAANRAVAS